MEKTHVAVGSLGPGAYSIELQVRYRDVTGVASSMSINALAPWLLHVIDGAPGP